MAALRFCGALLVAFALGLSLGRLAQVVLMALCPMVRF